MNHKCNSSQGLQINHAVVPVTIPVLCEDKIIEGNSLNLCPVNCTVTNLVLCTVRHVRILINVE